MSSNSNKKSSILNDTDELINLSFLKRTTKLAADNNNKSVVSLNNYLTQMSSENNFNLIPDAKQLQMAVLGIKSPTKDLKNIT